MRTKMRLRGATLGLLLCWATFGWGQTDSQLLNQLGSKDVDVRVAALEALVQKGPWALPGLFERLGPVNPTADIWAKRAIHRIVNDAARPGAEDSGQQVEDAMLAVLKGNYPPSKRRLAMESLRSVGGCRSVPVLRALFMNRNERQHARQALERIPCPLATDALARGISETGEPEWKIALVNSLGAKGDLDGRKGILRALRDGDMNVRLAALAAAAKLPHPRTQAAATSVWKRGSAEERMAAADALLQMAEVWTETGDTRRAFRICRGIYKEAEDSVMRCAGLAGIAETGAIEAVGVLIAALKDTDTDIRGVARDRLRFMPGEAVTAALVEALLKAESDIHSDLILLIAERREPIAQSAVTVLIDSIHEGRAEERRAAAQALESVPGRDISDNIIQSLQHAPPDAQAELIRILGKRGNAGALPVIRRYARSEELEVQAAAVQALGDFADPSSGPVLTAALTSNQDALVDAAVPAAIRVAAALEKLGRNAEAVDLCKEAANHAKDAEDLRRLAERLNALGAQEYVSEMGKRSGYIVHWRIAGPMPVPQSEVQKEFIDTSQPVDLSTPVAAGGKTLPWKAVRIASPMGHISLEREVARGSNIGAYLYAEVSSESIQEVRLSIGSNDQFICYFNGEKVHQFMGGRNWAPDQDSVRVHLLEGTNRILLKVLNMGGDWGASLRITDLEGHRAEVIQLTE